MTRVKGTKQVIDWLTSLFDSYSTHVLRHSAYFNCKTFCAVGESPEKLSNKSLLQNNNKKNTAQFSLT